MGMSRRNVERLLVIGGGVEITVGGILTAWPTLAPPWVGYFIIAIGVATIASAAVLYVGDWKDEQRAIIRAELLAAQKPAEEIRLAKETLWNLRESGVPLRNKGKYLNNIDAVPEWTREYQSWHEQLMEIAGKYSPDFKRTLNPIDKITPRNVEAVAIHDGDHQINVSVMSEILDRLFKRLSETM
jgi:hypothetical protein